MSILCGTAARRPGKVRSLASRNSMPLVLINNLIAWGEIEAWCNGSRYLVVVFDRVRPSALPDDPRVRRMLHFGSRVELAFPIIDSWRVRS